MSPNRVPPRQPQTIAFEIWIGWGHVHCDLCHSSSIQTCETYRPSKSCKGLRCAYVYLFLVTLFHIQVLYSYRFSNYLGINDLYGPLDGRHGVHAHAKVETRVPVVLLSKNNFGRGSFGIAFEFDF